MLGDKQKFKSTYAKKTAFNWGSEDCLVTLGVTSFC